MNITNLNPFVNLIESKHSSYLAYEYFIVLVVTCKIGEDTRCTCHDVNVVALQDLDKHL